MKTIALFLIISTFSFPLFSQEFEVSQNVKLDKAEDYAEYEDEVLHCVDWLMKTPLNIQKPKRKDANAFLLKWIMGSPNVSIEINNSIVSFMKTSPDLLIIFMGGWTKYALESKDFKNKIAGSLAGIESVIEFYSKNRAFLGKDKNIEKYVKMKGKGTLKAFIEKNA